MNNNLRSKTMLRPRTGINIFEAEYLIDDISSMRNKNKYALQKSIIKFVCYFNLFECYLAEKEVDHWYHFDYKYYVEKEYLNDYFNYFYNRYVECNKVNRDFDDLCKFVKIRYKNGLRHNLLNKRNLLYALLSISYYFRNNMYHGYKALFELDKYVECFEKITEILLTIMKNAKEKRKWITHNSDDFD